MPFQGYPGVPGAIRDPQPAEGSTVCLTLGRISFEDVALVTNRLRLIKQRVFAVTNSSE